MKSIAELRKVVQQPSWSKEVVLWVGSEKDLLEGLGQAKHQTLDLLDLFDDGHLPMDDEETRLQLHRLLEERLRKNPTSGSNRVVLLVKSIGLLARYEVGLDPFYKWFAGSFGMVILLLEGLQEQPELPEDVKCDSAQLLRYFKVPDMVQAVYGN